MRKYAILFMLVLGSCAGGGRPPVNQTDACAVLEQKRGWLKDLQASEREWGIPVAVQMATIWKESSYRGRVKTRRTFFLGIIPTGRISSAEGYAQAVDGTWDWYRKDTGNRRASRNDFGDSTDFIGWYMNKSAQTLGIKPEDAFNQYLAYHEGHGGYRRGSHKDKAWLLSTAREVEAMAIRYSMQLPSCT